MLIRQDNLVAEIKTLQIQVQNLLEENASTNTKMFAMDRRIRTLEGENRCYKEKFPAFQPVIQDDPQ